MSELAQTTETVRLFFRWTALGVVVDPSPVPTALIYAPDGSSVSLDLSKQGNTDTTRYYADVTKSSPGEYEILVTTSDAAVDAQTFQEFVRVGQGGIDYLDASINSRLPSGSYTAPPTAIQVRQEIDSNSTQLALLVARLTSTRAGLLDNLSRLDVATSELLADVDYTAPDNTGIATLLTRISSARALLLDNLSLVDIAISTRLAAAGYTVPPTTTQISQAIIDKVVPGGQPTNSVGLLLRTAGSTTDPLTNLVPGVYEEGSGGFALGLLRSGRLTILSPLNAVTGDLELMRGDDYDHVYHPIPPWTSSAWASYNLDDGTTTVAFKALATGGTLFTTPCVIQSATSVYVELTSEQTSAFPAGTYSMRYEVEATLTSGDVITLARGKLSILEDLR